MNSSKQLIQAGLALALTIGTAFATEVPAAKIDNGLGELPSYGQWQSHPELARFVGEATASGEKRDSGLGELPPYSEWKSRPELAGLVVVGDALALRK